MKGKILEDGHLSITRVGEPKKVSCQFRNGARCGDHCAGFGEPKKKGKVYMLKICSDTLIFDEFDDLRHTSETAKQMSFLDKVKHDKKH